MTDNIKETDNSVPSGRKKKPKLIAAALILAIIAGGVLAYVRLGNNGNQKNDNSKEDLAVSENAVIPREFVTNDGEIITYDKAVERMVTDAKAYLKAMETPADKADAVINDITDMLYKQQYEAESRAVDNHGIRHIYEAYTRSKSYLDSLEDITEEKKLAVLISHVYHDTGYLENPVNIGILKGGSGKEHGSESLKVWQSEDKKALYAEVLSASVLSSVNTAIGRHDSENVSNIRMSTAFGGDVVVSAVHISNMLSLSSREVLPEVLVCDNRITELVAGINSLLPVLENEKVGFFGPDGKLTSKGELFVTEYHDIVCDYINSLGFDKEYSDRLILAVQKDLGLDTGDALSDAAHMYIPSDAFVCNTKEKKNEITVQLIKYSSDKSDENSRESLTKLYRRLGLSEDKAAEAAKENRYEFTDGRGLGVNVKTVALKDIVASEKKKFDKNTDLEDMQKSIARGIGEYKDLADKLSKVVAYMGGSALSYNDFKEITRISGDSNTIYTEAGFESLNPLEKRDAINEIMTGMIFDKIAVTLE